MEVLNSNLRINLDFKKQLVDVGGFNRLTQLVDVE